MRYFSEVRQGLVRDLGGEAQITTAQRLLIDRIIFKLGFLRLVEIWVCDHGPFRQDGQGFEPVVEVYLSYANSLRNDLVQLGIERKDFPQVIDLKEYLKLKSEASEKPEVPDSQKTGLQRPSELRSGGGEVFGIAQNEERAHGPSEEEK